MRFALYSDLHLELRHSAPELPVLEVDAVILAGDIGNGLHGLQWAGKKFLAWPGSPHVVYVMGNHEYYGHDLDIINTPRVGVDRLWLLEKSKLNLPGVRILGCTLWSDFNLYGDPPMAMYRANTSINDFRLIKNNGEYLTPIEVKELHLQSLKWLKRELSKPFDGKTVVITHFSPHPKCVCDQYAGDSLTPYFVCDMSPLMKKYPIDLWCYGHTHGSVDFTVHGCRVVSNQCGYRGEVSQSGFRPNLIIEV